ncbi:MAG: Hsp20/alpha crystallin family protein [Akkermansiaceae bacterium]|nr:Hsp20/alpha crystallin family protein [Akkermansiaceae bacterium]
MQLIRHTNPRTSIPNDIDHWFLNFLRDFGSLGNGTGTTNLSVDLHESKDAYHATFAMPGIAKDDVEIELDNSVLTVNGKVTRKSDNEHYESTFNRSITVPDGVKTDGISASMQDGLLTVTMPKSEDKKPVAISVN